MLVGWKDESTVCVPAYVRLCVCVCVCVCGSMHAYTSLCVTPFHSAMSPFHSAGPEEGVSNGNIPEEWHSSGSEGVCGVSQRTAGWLLSTHIIH